MNENSKIIIALCSHLGENDNVKPLESREYEILAHNLIVNKKYPGDIASMSDNDIGVLLEGTKLDTDRVLRLVDRAAGLSFEIQRYENMGIRFITRADDEYPCKIKQKLKSKCPPLFYTIGNMELLNRDAIGFVGSRNITEADIEFTQGVVKNVVENGYTVVSGAARGVDQVSMRTSLEHGGNVIGYVADSLLSKIKDSSVMSAVLDDRLALLSVAKPDAHFDVGLAMMRNKYIYAQSEGAVVVKSDYEKGGTWAGAVENLKNQWCPLYCREYSRYKGNSELIRRGAVPISEDWIPGQGVGNKLAESKITYQQLSIFD